MPSETPPAVERRGTRRATPARLLAAALLPVALITGLGAGREVPRPRPRRRRPPCGQRSC
ncbi:hypothetical protein ACFQV2_24830 [Actinokineospora soli]|uniref:Uncharacterized protein n=1 Tax=Actinokineospora soli TaxID=1048753 RepID=A0ABW2TUV7_9PSEU